LATLTVVVGLPGSGKSHLLCQLRESCTGLTVEDYHKNARSDSSLVTASRHYADLVRALREGRDCAIADVAFTDRRRRREVEKVFRRDVPGLSLDWVFFANDLEACVANIRRRGHPEADLEERVATTLSATYVIPRGAAALRIWRPEECSLDA